VNEFRVGLWPWRGNGYIPKRYSRLKIKHSIGLEDKFGKNKHGMGLSVKKKSSVRVVHSRSHTHGLII
jgi:hypothetical protein